MDKCAKTAVHGALLDALFILTVYATHDDNNVSAFKSIHTIVSMFQIKAACIKCVQLLRNISWNKTKPCLQICDKGCMLLKYIMCDVLIVYTWEQGYIIVHMNMHLSLKVACTTIVIGNIHFQYTLQTSDKLYQAQKQNNLKMASEFR